jgi:hypothetical protein
MWLAVVVLAVLITAPAATARAQTSTEAVESDSVEVAQPRFRFSPKLDAKTTAQVTYNEMGATFNNTFFGFNNLSVTTLISANEKNYRLQDRIERNKQLNNTLTKSLLPGLTFVLNQSDSRQLSRATLVTGESQDFVLNNKSLTAAANYMSAQGYAMRWDARGSVNLQNNEFAFKSDKGQGGAINGGVRYLMLDNRVRVRVRGALSDQSEKSSSIYETFDGLGATSDSMQTLVDVQVADSLDVGLEWTNYNYERDFADQSRGSSGTQQVGAENLFRETERREYRRYGVNMTSTPFGGLTINTSANHIEQLSDYINTPSRFSRSVGDELRGDLSYRVRSGLSVALKLENSETLRDLGPQSVSSYTDKRRRVSLSLSKKFTETLNVDVTLAEGIGQQFYVKFAENPRDRDQLESSVKGRISSKLFNKVSTSMFLAVTSTDIVSIHQSNSRDNRTRLRYDFKPDITYTYNDRVKVEQGYGLAIEFTDYDYTFIGQDDFIDRNVTFWNRVTHQATKRLRNIFYYSLTLHDRGAYLPEDSLDFNNPDAERFLEVDRKDRTDIVKISFNYKLNEHLTAVGEYEYSRRRDTTVGSSNDRITTTGGIEGGIVGFFKWSAAKTLNFTFKRVERFSPFVSGDQAKYWDANAAFKYAF